MKFKQFYLLIKIANIRKRLTENESLNNEICLDKMSNKELINVKLLVKALEELAEEEQKSLIEEEKEAAEKLAKEKTTNEESKNTLGCSDVDTPRSESDLKQNSNEEDTVQAKETKPPSPDPMDDKKLASMSRESYGVDNMIKFGNA